MIGGAVYWKLEQADGGDTGSGGPTDRSFTPQELAQYDGKDGNQCLVAVDGEVYS